MSWRLVVSTLLALVLPLAPLAAALAEEVTNTQVPVEATLFDACTGEAVHFTGTLHIQAMTSGTTTEFHDDYHDVTGVGLQTGTRYVVQDTVRATFVSLGGSAFSYDETNRLRLISQGSSPDAFLVAQFHRSFPPLVITFTILSIECRG